MHITDCIECAWEHEEFEVETDEPGEWPVPFSSETVRAVRTTTNPHLSGISPLAQSHVSGAVCSVTPFVRPVLLEDACQETNFATEG